MSFIRRKAIQLSSALFDTRALSLKAYPIVARILFNCQRAIPLKKGNDSIEPNRLIESPWLSAGGLVQPIVSGIPLRFTPDTIFIVMPSKIRSYLYRVLK
jgi:hypothetical protein